MAYSKTLKPEDELPKWLPKLGAYFLHIVLAWIGILAISLFLGAGVSWLNDNLAGAIFFESPYPGEIVLGLLIGYAANKVLRSRFVLWFWVLPTLPILDEFYGSPWRDTFHYLFVARCTNCIEQLFIVAPFYGSIAYSLGAWVALKQNSRRTVSTLRSDEANPRAT